MSCIIKPPPSSPRLFPNALQPSVTDATRLASSSFSTALLIGEKAAVLVAEDLGYSGDALKMTVPTYNAPGEMQLPFRL